MFTRYSNSPIVVTVLLTAAGVLVSLVVTMLVMALAGYPYPPIAYVLAAGLPAIVAPLYIYPLMRAHARLRHMRAELERQARTDALTGLPNRRALFEQSERMLARPVQGTNPLTAMMIDVDNFKLINDGHGHDAGDAILKAVATVIRDLAAAAGATDWMAARIGGEEFALLVEGLVPSAVGRLAEKICQGVRRVGEDRQGERIGATVSVGVAFRAERMGIDALLKAADDAVHVAKRSGRDRWAFAFGGTPGEDSHPPPTRQAVQFIPRPATR